MGGRSCWASGWDLGVDDRIYDDLEMFKKLGKMVVEIGEMSTEDQGISLILEHNGGGLHMINDLLTTRHI